MRASPTPAVRLVWATGGQETAFHKRLWQRALARVTVRLASLSTRASAARQPKRSTLCTCTLSPFGKRRWMEDSSSAASLAARATS